MYICASKHCPPQREAWQVAPWGEGGGVVWVLVWVRGCGVAQGRWDASVVWGGGRRAAFAPCISWHLACMPPRQMLCACGVRVYIVMRWWAYLPATLSVLHAWGWLVGSEAQGGPSLLQLQRADLEGVQPQGSVSAQCVAFFPFLPSLPLPVASAAVIKPGFLQSPPSCLRYLWSLSVPLCTSSPVGRSHQPDRGALLCAINSCRSNSRQKRKEEDQIKLRQKMMMMRIGRVGLVKPAQRTRLAVLAQQQQQSPKPTVRRPGPGPNSPRPTPGGPRPNEPRLGPGVALGPDGQPLEVRGGVGLMLCSVPDPPPQFAWSADRPLHQVIRVESAGAEAWAGVAQVDRGDAVFDFG